ncbi:MAG TPA: hypothetical protein VNL91_09185 [Thermoanaerobaculia bacterium]|nr:hypothetical protein [Thermoanaerobaculia bacterium]
MTKSERGGRPIRGLPKRAAEERLDGGSRSFGSPRESEPPDVGRRGFPTRGERMPPLYDDSGRMRAGVAEEF